MICDFDNLTITSVSYTHLLPYVYPKNVETAAEKIPAEISEADYAEPVSYTHL